jgi:Na+/melibiose symporter-like transporter
LLIAAATTFSRVGIGQPVPAVSQALLPSLRQVFADVAFRRLLIVFVANGIAAALPATLFLFFVADVLQATSASGPLLALYFVAGAASLPLWVRLSARHGRVFAWLVAMAVSMVAFAGASLLGSGDIGAFSAICVASGLALGADLALPAAIAADLGERQGRPAPASVSGTLSPNSTWRSPPGFHYPCSVRSAMCRAVAPACQP